MSVKVKKGYSRPFISIRLKWNLSQKRPHFSLLALNSPFLVLVASCQQREAGNEVADGFLLALRYAYILLLIYLYSAKSYTKLILNSFFRGLYEENRGTAMFLYFSPPPKGCWFVGWFVSLFVDWLTCWVFGWVGRSVSQSDKSASLVVSTITELLHGCRQKLVGG